MSGTSPLTFQFVFQAAYPQTRFIIPDTVVPAGIQVNRYPDSPVLFEAKSMEYGLKVAYLKSDFDLSFSLFHGFTSFPEYVFNSLTQTIVAINPAESAVGSDGSFTFKSYIVRWETALHLPENGQANDPLFGLVEPSHWDSVLGIERPLFQDFRIQVQALYRWHLYFRDEPYTSSANPVVNQIQQGVARANATLLNYRRRGNPGATFRLAYAKERAVWTADLFLVGYFATGQDFLLRPQVGFTPRENLKLLAGLDLYGGDVSGPLGALHVQSDAFFEAKLLF